MKLSENAINVCHSMKTSGKELSCSVGKGSVKFLMTLQIIGLEFVEYMENHFFFPVF